jgi:hypothetical protein
MYKHISETKRSRAAVSPYPTGTESGTGRVAQPFAAKRKRAMAAVSSSASLTRCSTAREVSRTPAADWVVVLAIDCVDSETV